MIEEVKKSLVSLDKKLALVANDLKYVRKEIEGNGKKGLIQCVDEIKDKHDEDMKDADKRFDKISDFQNKLIGGLIVVQIVIGAIIKFF